MYINVDYFLYIILFIYKMHLKVIGHINIVIVIYHFMNRSS